MDNIYTLKDNLLPSVRMPVLFIGHGNPMNVIMDNEITRNWNLIGQNLGNVQKVVVISAHLLTRGTFVTSNPKPELIYDFYGFPQQLYNIKYEVSGDLTTAQSIKEYLKYETFLDSNRGLDHGTWTVLKHLIPSSNIPVVQISLNINQSLDEMIDFFSLLKPLRDKGVVFIGSGNLIHNLRALDPKASKPFDWALDFDQKLTESLEERNINILSNPYKLGNVTSLAIPTDDHYRPMIASFALTHPEEQLVYFNENIFELGSIGMRSFITK